MGAASLGLSLEGTVDVENGTELRPHHYIQSIQPGSLAGQSGILKPGDELLEVTRISHIYGEISYNETSTTWVLGNHSVKPYRKYHNDD